MGGIIGEIFSCEKFSWIGWCIVIIFAFTMYPIDLIRKLLFNK